MIPGSARETQPKPGSPHGWIQWKGTTVCVDLNCSCGGDWHIDDEFMYYVRCPTCKTVYYVSGYIELVPLLPDEDTSQITITEETE